MAAPGTDKTDQASTIKPPPAGGASAPPERPAGPPRRRGRSFVGRLFLSALVLLIVLGVAGYGALIFRNADPRVGVAANYVDEGLVEAQSALDKAQAIIAELSGQTARQNDLKPDSVKGASRPALLDKAPLQAPETAQEAAPAPKVDDTAAAPAAPAPSETASEPEKPAEAPAPAPEARQEAIAPEATPKAVEAAPESAPVPSPVPAPATVAATPAPAAKPNASDANDFSDRDLIAALEGRIDALSDEVQSLRAKLDAPKNETRAAPETQSAKAAPAAVADTSSAAVVLAFALQRDLDAGRPFTDEIAAFSRLDAEPAPSPNLIELAEKGAPTGAQLHERFLPIAKKLKGHETHAEETHDANALTEHLLQGASKLVKVRPAGQAEPESLDGKLDRIEAALGRNDFATAENLFDSLPEEARSQAKDFGVSLHQRSEAAKAADELLRGAIASLGKK